ncbi:hypothetical protein PanWU01x14_353520, partial [Parasponia andersonii]
AAAPCKWCYGAMALMPQCCGVVEWRCSVSSLELWALRRKCLALQCPVLLSRCLSVFAHERSKLP